MRILLISSILLFILASCGDIDNFDTPNATVKGGIYDKSTQQLIPAQSPNGARVRFFEKGMPQPNNFWCKSDGTFENTQMFSGSYKIIVEGPFVVLKTDTINADIPYKDDVNFYVDPYLTIDADMSMSGDDLTYKIKIKKSPNWDKKLESYSVIYSTTEHIDFNTHQYRKDFSLPEGANEADYLNKEITVKLNKDDYGSKLNKNRPIYLRVSAKTGGTSYYNYSKVVKVANS